ncbi:MAG TPA: aminotransferase class III-fold pyridoxal phosphate-dependent enzyme, partial [Niabella sp.]|nr:aminotransferase class III-fold pyridoxal phosphate-dependent enzyme [Niabella sp.]
TFGGNHLACAAAVAVLEVMEEENLMDNATKMGNYLMEELKKTEPLKNIRGRGLMIGFDVPEEIGTLRKNLLNNQKIFTGMANPNVIRVLPSLALQKSDADKFLKAIKLEIEHLKN